jgi:hypothetical protein
VTIKPRPQSMNEEMSDLYRRVRRLEAVPPGDGGGCTCQCVEGDANRRLPIDMGNYIGDVSYGFRARINEFVVDTACEGNGYYQTPANPPGPGPGEFDVTYWTPWLGPTGARFRLNIVTLTGPAAGRLHLYGQRMVETATPGIWEPEGAPIDLFAGFAGRFADLYSGSTQRNIWNVSYDFGIEGEGCDTPFTFSDPDADYGYALDGSPSFYRLWVVVEGKHASSSGYECKIQNAWLKRIFQEEA